MNPRYSLRNRLAGFAILVVASTMLATWIGLTIIFERSVERREGQELDSYLDQIIGGLRFGPNGEVTLERELSDPRFDQVLGGLYYQVSTLDGTIVLKSRSLWDTTLDLPDDVHEPGAVHVYQHAGPNDTDLLLHESRIEFLNKGETQSLLITVAIDTTELEALKSGFSRDLVLALVSLAVVLLFGFAFQIGAGLRPLDRLRQGISDVKSGREKRLSTDAPTEVIPLIDEVNSLLDLQEESMIRAQDRAADLAHGLKTPLTALGTDIEKLRKIGADTIADDIQELSSRMRRHLDRELALARDRHGRASARTSAQTALSSIVRALEKTPKGEKRIYANNVPNWVQLAVDQGDFLEVAGNLLENATKFAASKIAIDCGVKDGWATIVVSDDGPGVDAKRLTHISKRGVRLDTSGSGLGLAIVKDIVDAYQGQLFLENKPDGGLSATVILPVSKKIDLD